MKNITQTLTNVMLTILLAFVVYISLDTQKKMQFLIHRWIPSSLEIEPISKEG